MAAAAGMPAGPRNPRGLKLRYTHEFLSSLKGTTYAALGEQPLASIPAVVAGSSFHRLTPQVKRRRRTVPIPVTPPPLTMTEMLAAAGGGVASTMPPAAAAADPNTATVHHLIPGTQQTVAAGAVDYLGADQRQLLDAVRARVRDGRVRRGAPLPPTAPVVEDAPPPAIPAPAAPVELPPPPQPYDARCGAAPPPAPTPAPGGAGCGDGADAAAAAAGGTDGGTAAAGAGAPAKAKMRWAVEEEAAPAAAAAAAGVGRGTWLEEPARWERAGYQQREDWAIAARGAKWVRRARTPPPPASPPAPPGPGAVPHDTHDMHGAYNTSLDPCAVPYQPVGRPPDPTVDAIDAIDTPQRPPAKPTETPDDALPASFAAACKDADAYTTPSASATVATPPASCRTLDDDASSASSLMPHDRPRARERGFLLPPVPPNMFRQGKDVEDDYHRLVQREKQIQMGMDTIGYRNYIRATELQIEFPKMTKMALDSLQKVPNIYQKVSKRSWDGQLRRWRSALHEFDHLTEQLWPDQEAKKVQAKEDKDARRRAKLKVHRLQERTQQVLSKGVLSEHETGAVGAPRWMAGVPTPPPPPRTDRAAEEVSKSGWEQQVKNRATAPDDAQPFPQPYF